MIPGGGAAAFEVTDKPAEAAFDDEKNAPFGDTDD